VRDQAFKKNGIDFLKGQKLCKRRLLEMNIIMRILSFRTQVNPMMKNLFSPFRLSNSSSEKSPFLLEKVTLESRRKFLSMFTEIPVNDNASYQGDTIEQSGFINRFPFISVTPHLRSNRLCDEHR
jgi:hypothetical protein